jgi:medium-chain acyl-[acyl-carrier-protein] hydrolase
MTNRWLICPRPNPRASLRLFCFPYAGGAASVFRRWSHDLPSDVEVLSVELPGRGTRIREAPIARLAPLVHELTTALLPLCGKPFAFFGHSMGALVSFEATRELRRRGAPLPHRLFVSAAAAPDTAKSKVVAHQQSDAELKEQLRRLNGTPQPVLEHDELMEFLLPIVRADFAVFETYEYVDEPALACPISVFGGAEDENVSRKALEGWREQTDGPFSIRMFPGDHFFIHSVQPSVLRTLAQELR